VLHPASYYQFYFDVVQDESVRSDSHGALLAPMLVALDFPPPGVASCSVLDLGFGTGKWCSDFLDVYEFQDYEVGVTHVLSEHPRAFRRTDNMPQVIGVDIFDRDEAHSEQPESDEDNVDAAGFERRVFWNLNAPISTMPRQSGLRREVFHLINSRFLADGINTNRWCSLMEDCWELLVPGGWLQMIEPVWAFQSDLGQDLPCLEAWWNHYADALRLMQKNVRVGRDLFGHMIGARFQSIASDSQKVPAAGWKEGTSKLSYVHVSSASEANLHVGEKKKGRDNSEQIIGMLRTHSLDPFKRILGMSDDDYERVVKEAQSELAERGETAKIYIRVSVLLESSEVPFADCDPGILCTDKSRRGHVLQALPAVRNVESNNTSSLCFTDSAQTYRLASAYGVNIARLIGRPGSCGSPTREAFGMFGAPDVTDVGWVDVISAGLMEE
jgi:hypothetical protein